MEKCDECKKGFLKHEKIDYKLLGVSLGNFDALVCSFCGETLFEGRTFKLIEKAAKAKRLWGLNAKTRIGTAGNALDVRLPKAITQFLNLKKGQEVIIEPLDKKRFQVTLE
ncbi:hypothetical protein HYX16_01190 [Candidatus Woesearchaeota archaeon]|nr:hypothetical protein [Candidatus Woesearchaeota archaeon]